MNQITEPVDVYRSFFDDAIEGMYRTAPDGRIIMANRACAQIFGIATPEEFIASCRNGIIDFYVDPQARAVATKILQEEGALLNYEYQARRADGVLVWVSSSAKAVFDDKGKIDHYDGIVQDITEIRAATEALRESEARHRQILDDMLDTYYRTDAEGRIVMASSSAARLLGCPLEELIGQRLADFCAEVEIQEAFLAALKAASGELSGYEARLKRRDDTIVWVSISARFLRDEAGNIAGMEGIARDISEHKLAGQQLQQMRLAIDKKDEILVLYDPDDRLVFCNEKFREINKEVADLIRPGVTFETLTRAGLELGLIPEAVGREDEWLQERLERHRNPKGPVEQDRQGGIWHLIQEQRLDDGSTISIVSDITDHKRTAQALEKNEEQLRLVIDSLPVLICYVDTNERFLYVNRTCADWYGRTQDEIVGKYVSDIHRNRYPLFKPHIDAVLSGKSLTFEDQNLYPDGVWREIRSLHVPHLNSAGVVQGYFSLTEDITESKRAERALRESEARFRDFAELATDWLWETDAEGKFTYTTRRIFETVQVEPNDVIGKRREELFRKYCRPLDGDTGGEWEKHFSAIERREPFRDLKYQVMTPHDGDRIFLSNGKPIYDDQGKFQGYRGLAVDVTERHALEDRLHQAQKMEAVGQLTGGVAHEFNNLLQVISGNIELLAENISGDEKTEQRFQAIQRNVGRGADLTSRLLAFSRRQPLVPGPLAIGNILAEVKDLLGQTLGETIEIRVEPADDIWIAEADPGQLENALLNLALNARDAMPDGGLITLSAKNISLDVAMAAAHEGAKAGDYVVLSLADNGCGMTKNAVDRAFEPFFTTKDVGKGTGLGLSMVYGFARQSGGFAEIESEVGRGTTMHLYLPRLASAGAVETAARNTMPAAVSPGDGTILLVEDDLDVRESLTYQLEDLGYRVIQAKDGATALAALSHEPEIDLLFTDVVMPGGLSGMELAHRIRALRPGLKVLYSTGYSEDTVSNTGQLDDAAVVLRKPYDKSKLARTISKILN